VVGIATYGQKITKKTQRKQDKKQVEGKRGNKNMRKGKTFGDVRYRSSK
jgi:hypothetical protein